MYSFLGEIEAKADNKGRLFIPAQYRKLLSQEGDSRLVIRQNDQLNCLDIYPESIWKAELLEVKSRLDLLDDDDYALFMQYTGSATTLDIDSNGRVLVPRKQLDEIEIVSDVLFVGAFEKIALWKKSTYENSKLSREEFLKKKKEKLSKKL